MKAHTVVIKEQEESASKMELVAGHVLADGITIVHMVVLLLIIFTRARLSLAHLRSLQQKLHH